jgi:hypothetical protein
MADTGPYAHLNKLNDRAKSGVAFRSMPGGQTWPLVPAQDPTSKKWSLVPIDPHGFPTFDPSQNGGDGWKIIDPTDQNALAAAGIDPAGFPRDHGPRRKITDQIHNLLKLVPVPAPNPGEPRPNGGLRGDINRGAVGLAADTSNKPSDFFTTANNRTVDATGWQNGMFDSALGPVLQTPGRLVSSQQQSNFDSSAVDQRPVDYGTAADTAPDSSDDISELLKLRSIIQAVGSRGLFPIQ